MRLATLAAIALSLSASAESVRPGEFEGRGNPCFKAKDGVSVVPPESRVRYRVELLAADGGTIGDQAVRADAARRIAIVTLPPHANGVLKIQAH